MVSFWRKSGTLPDENATKSVTSVPKYHSSSWRPRLSINIWGHAPYNVSILSKWSPYVFFVHGPLAKYTLWNSSPKFQSYEESLVCWTLWTWSFHSTYMVKKNIFTFAKRNGKFCEWMHNKEIYYVKLSYFVFLFMNEKICYFWDLLLKAKAIHYSTRIAFAMAVSPHTVWKKVKFTLIWRILREINFQWKSCFHVILLKNLESEILKFSHCVSVTSRPFFKCMKPVK